MNDLKLKNQIFLGILLAGIIIAIGVYFGISNYAKIIAVKAPDQTVNSSQQNTVASKQTEPLTGEYKYIHVGTILRTETAPDGGLYLVFCENCPIEVYIESSNVKKFGNTQNYVNKKVSVSTNQGEERKVLSGDITKVINRLILDDPNQIEILEK